MNFGGYRKKVLLAGVANLGSGRVILHDLDEEYVMTFPSGYGRSIMSTPWVELGGKVRCSVFESWIFGIFDRVETALCSVFSFFERSFVRRVFLVWSRTPRKQLE